MTLLEGLAGAGLLAELHRQADPDAAWSEPAFARLLQMPGAFALAGPDGFLLARAAADEAEILMLAVRPGARRQGLGQLLVEACGREAARRGVARLFLEVASTNVAARALYAAAGFDQVGVRRGYYPDGGDALVLVRALSPCAG